MNSAPTRVVAGLRQLEADLGRLAREEGVRDLHQDAGAVAGARVGADGAAMFEVHRMLSRVGDDLMRLLALDVGDEADAAGILFQAEVVQTLGRRTPGMFALRCRARLSAGFEAGAADSASVTMFSRSNSDPLISRPLNQARASPSSSAHLGRLRHPPGHRSSSASRNFRIKAWAFNVPEERPCLLLPGASAPDFRCNPCAGSAPLIETVILS